MCIYINKSAYFKTNNIVSLIAIATFKLNPNGEFLHNPLKLDLLLKNYI